MAYQEPEFLPWDGRRVPLTFVAGYLGAGKTTLINRVLRETDRPIAVIVNDVGAINIDAKLIRKQSGETIELSDGCVCCSSIEGFGAAFDQLRARDQAPDHVLVELSGVAEPANVLPWGRSAGFKLDGVITLVAADQFLDIADDPIIGEKVRDQVVTGDLVAITKGDHVGAHAIDAVTSRVAELAPDAAIVTADDPALRSMLLRIGGRRSGSSPSIETTLATPSLFDRHTVDVVPLPQPIERSHLDKLVDELDHRVMRAKAIAAGPNGERWAVQVVGRRRSILELPPVEAQSEAPTDLVVIKIR